MEIVVRGKPKEIADLAHVMQDRQCKRIQVKVSSRDLQKDFLEAIRHRPVKNAD